ncbi:MAG: SDR family oxidoreductase [Thermoplasmata archaeon]|uniref:SDR family oxidoreductase n=1 Tax=Candidatus Sysuiplasma superficiale TaxID=2823368 RepID=A0A8J8CGY7_9ARCH|nr:SDR family oxidoreductase [Candidatus Sysuiplasma superficiale]MBX8643298.1 SDR family oxidoreductase [Candidatus Sysuiplasma superficiale]
MPPKDEFNGRSVIVTGGTSGIGLATASLFAERGANVIITGKSREKGQKALKSIRGKGDTEFFKGNVSSVTDAEKLVSLAERKHGGLDILVNNAGVYLAKKIDETSEEEWDWIINTNLKGVYITSRFSIPLLKKSRGCIVNVASVSGLVGVRNEAAYCASKGGVIQLTKAMALDYASDGIRVNAVCPGDVETPMMWEALNRVDDRNLAVEKDKALHPLGRFGRAEEVAKLILYLSSADAAFITGSAVSIDGGWSAY